MSFYKNGKVLLTGLFFFTCLTGFAQKPENILDQWSERSPIEKVYLHFDRENYIAGETAWFKAYLYSDFLPDTISTTLYVELFNDSSVMVSRKILPVLSGNTNGQFELPDSLKTGYYFIKAYSLTMFSRDPAFMAQQYIFVSGKKRNSDAVAIQKQLRLEFFPESGNFITGSINTVAFKATDENGLPVTVSGNIRNEKNEVLASFTAYHDGMGMFDMTPLPNAKYYAVIHDDATMHKYYLPEQTDKGIMFKVISTGKKKYFELLQPSGPYFKAAYMIGQMQHHIVFRQDFPPGKENITGTIDISDLSSGILQVTVFNKDDIPLAERLTFVDNGEYIQHGELIADTIDFSERGKNTFHVSLKDTVLGFFSVAVTDPEYSLHSTRQQNILSTLLLTSDLKGYIHNPAYYFSDNSDSVQNALDLVMMINGWRRFKWSSLLSNTLPAALNKDAGYIAVGGHLYLKGTKKPFANKPFVIFIYGPDSSRIIRMSSTDTHGYFKIDSLLFFDRARLLFKDVRGKKSDLLEVNLSDDSLTKKFQIPGVDKQNFSWNIFPDENQEKKLGYDYDAISKAQGLILAEVILKAKKKNSLQELEEKYASGLFSGFSERTIDLVNTNDVNSYENILEYLSYKVPGVNISRDGLDYYIYYRQIASVSSMGLIPMTLYLDEMETDASFISSIPASQVAMVKVYSSFVGAVGNGAGGALAIYTKKGTDLYNSALITDIIRYQGYSVIKEFYAPDYSVNTTAIKKPDNRITLFWSPQIIVSSINGYIPVTFYNNDRTKQFKIVVEGMTTDGKLLMIEKTFGRKPF
ncbi:MAG TPA: hypothetical protein VK483_13660 [Chitinophagaceae bacterium]|nr:hypothetical protein [Chitinophagaceae bacterium]